MGGVELSCRPWPAAGFLLVASNLRVAGGKENAFGQRSLSNVQIAHFVSCEVNEYSTSPWYYFTSPLGVGSTMLGTKWEPSNTNIGVPSGSLGRAFE